MFWSSGNLTGSQTAVLETPRNSEFWSSGNLTGSQTPCNRYASNLWFWSSGNLTGSQTGILSTEPKGGFWNSSNLMGRSRKSLITQAEGSTFYAKDNKRKIHTGGSFCIVNSFLLLACFTDDALRGRAPRPFFRH